MQAGRAGTQGGDGHRGTWPGCFHGSLQRQTWHQKRLRHCPGRRKQHSATGTHAPLLTPPTTASQSLSGSQRSPAPKEDPKEGTEQDHGQGGTAARGPSHPPGCWDPPPNTLGFRRVSIATQVPISQRVTTVTELGSLSREKGPHALSVKQGSQETQQREDEAWRAGRGQRVRSRTRDGGLASASPRPPSQS